MTDERDIQDLLNEPIPRDCISEKQGLSYVSHRYIKERLNFVFGWDGWSYEVVDKVIFEEKLSCFAHVRLTVMGNQGPVTRDGMALGFPAGQSTVQSFDFAIAESITDALKRAAVSLGSSMGLELYPMTKGEQPPKPGPPAPRPPTQSMSDKPLVAEKAQIERYVGSIGGSTSLSGLQMVGLSIKDSDLSKGAKDELHGIYAAKKRELESVPD